jgi:hypothetical protein
MAHLSSGCHFNLVQLLLLNVTRNKPTQSDPIIIRTLNPKTNPQKVL